MAQKISPKYMMRVPRLNAKFSPRRIVVFRALYLGDLLCATPALRALRQRFPAAEITLIGLPWAGDFVARIPSVDRLLLFPGFAGIAEVPYQAERVEQFLAQVHATGYDLAIQMHGDGHISNGFVAGLGARVSLGYCCGVDGRLDYTLPYDIHEHETRRWLHLVAQLGATTDDTRLEFPTTPDEQATARQLLADVKQSTGPIIGVHVGAKDALRRWPTGRFAALADLLVGQFGAQIVLTGGTNEQELTVAVRAAMQHDALDLAGKTDLGVFASVISQLDLLVTNDTGASHLAAATATASVVLFGPTRPQSWAPLDAERHRVIDAPTLLDHSDRMNALQELSVAPVLAVCSEMLGNREQSATNSTHPSSARSLVLGS
jgi:ADP-heptose:LPS heptosyltransferase